MKYLILIIILYSTINAQINLEENNTKISILEKSEMLLDSSSKLSFKEIQNKQFTKVNTDYIKLGYTSDTLWLKFKIKNNSNKKLIRHITLTNPMLDLIELYTISDSNTYIKEEKGLFHLDKYNRNNILHPTFKINFEKNETKTFYYKTHSMSSANYFKLYLKDHNQLYKDEFSYQLIEILFFGAMIAFIIYNFFIYLFTKEKTYLYYVMFIVFVTLNHASYSVMSHYILGEEVSKLDAYFAVYYLNFIVIFSILFIKSILELNKYKIISFILNILISINILIMILSLTVTYMIEFSAIYLFIVLLYLLFLCFYSFFKKHQLAKYIIVGWSINIFGIAMLAFKDYGFWSLLDEYIYLYEFTTFTEATLFSIALASKLNKTKELENSLKTNQILIREIHHRVKNNMQFIILMYRLKLSTLSNQQIDGKLKEVEGSIQAISQTHEILYNQENLDSINTSVYFQTLINELKKGFKTKDIDISLNIFTSLDVQNSIYCGIILNEIITNSFKYAFLEDKGEINISLEKVNNKYVFTIYDNGIGFDYEKEKNSSFGLSFIQAMVKDELKGNISFENKDGCKIKIQF